jgi:hypothetical protein
MVQILFRDGNWWDLLLADNNNKRSLATTTTPAAAAVHACLDISDGQYSICASLSKECRDTIWKQVLVVRSTSTTTTEQQQQQLVSEFRLGCFGVMQEYSFKKLQFDDDRPSFILSVDRWDIIAKPDFDRIDALSALLWRHNSTNSITPIEDSVAVRMAWREQTVPILQAKSNSSAISSNNSKVILGDAHDALEDEELMETILALAETAVQRDAVLRREEEEDSTHPEVVVAEQVGPPVDQNDDSRQEKEGLAAVVQEEEADGRLQTPPTKPESQEPTKQTQPEAINQVTPEVENDNESDSETEKEGSMNNRDIMSTKQVSQENALREDDEERPQQNVTSAARKRKDIDEEDARKDAKEESNKRRRLFNVGSFFQRFQDLFFSRKRGRVRDDVDRGGQDD